MKIELRGVARRQAIVARRIQYAPRLVKSMLGDGLVMSYFIHKLRIPLPVTGWVSDQSKSKYSPHQGPQECARHRRQMTNKGDSR